jgi:hypothetical protein
MQLLATTWFTSNRKPCVRDGNLRPERDDSSNSIICKNRQLCQRSHARSALRKAGCGFCAALLQIWRFSAWFLGNCRPSGCDLARPCAFAARQNANALCIGRKFLAQDMRRAARQQKTPAKPAF